MLGLFAASNPRLGPAARILRSGQRSRQDIPAVGYVLEPRPTNDFEDEDDDEYEDEQRIECANPSLMCSDSLSDGIHHFSFKDAFAAQRQIRGRGWERETLEESSAGDLRGAAAH
jgi:hypothetical protein